MTAPQTPLSDARLRLVPREPTPEWIKAMDVHLLSKYGAEIGPAIAREMIGNVLAAAPSIASTEHAGAAEGVAQAMIEAERQRQIDVEGWTSEHDDEHAHGEMLQAALIYRAHARGEILQHNEDGTPHGWPWELAWWKPKDPLSDLVRAGALCMADADRRRRAFHGRATMEYDPGSPAAYKLAMIIGDINTILRHEAAFATHPESRIVENISSPVAEGEGEAVLHISKEDMDFFSRGGSGSVLANGRGRKGSFLLTEPLYRASPIQSEVTDEMVQAFKKEHATLMMESLSYDETLKLALRASLAGRTK